MQPSRPRRGDFPDLRPLVICLAATFASTGSMRSGAATVVPAFSATGAQEFVASNRLLASTRMAANARVVSNCSDSGTGSLRDVLAQAVDGDIIDLRGLACSSITLESGEIATARSSLSLLGPGPDRLAIDGAGNGRVFKSTASSGLLTIKGVGLRNGHANGKGGCLYATGAIELDEVRVTSCQATASGGGVWARGLSVHASRIEDNIASLGAGGGGLYCASGGVTIDNSTIRGNNAASGNGGGVFAIGTVDVHGSTVAGNLAVYGGGLYLIASGIHQPLRIENSTISGNQATTSGGGVFAKYALDLSSTTIAFNSAGTAGGGGLFLRAATNLDSSIVARNAAGGDGGDIAGSGAVVLDGTGNLIQDSTFPVPADTLSSDPLLGPLSDNGSATSTHALLAGSPAIDAGNNPLMAHYDQRAQGNARVVGANADIGAYEVQSTGVVRTVATCADTGSGSLRDMIASSRSGDTIDLRHLTCSLITLGSGALVVPFGNLALVGPGARALSLDAAHHDRVLHHTGYGTLRISDLGLTNGSYYLGAGTAAGGCVSSASSVDIVGSEFTACQSVGREKAKGGAVFANRVRIVGSTVAHSGVAGESAYGGGIYAFGDFYMRDSTLSSNSAPAGIAGFGGGGGLATGGNADIRGSTINANQAAEGGGAVFFGATQLANSTVSGNTGSVFAGIVSVSDEPATFRNSTITFNVSAYSAEPSLGSGLFAMGPTQLQSSLFFGNTSNGAPYDIGETNGVRFTGANNLVGSSPVLLPPDTLHDDPQIGPLQDNGGPTWTHALAPASAAIDHGNNAADLPFDQRGEGHPRVSGAAADIGAFESPAANDDAIFFDGFEGLP